MNRLPGAIYSRNAEAALERGETVDPESIDVDAAPFVDELRRREEQDRGDARHDARESRWA